MQAPILSHDGLRLYHGDALDVLKELPPASCDALVTDPPAGIEFMGKEWDSFRGDTRQPGDETLHLSGAGPFDRAEVRHGTSNGYKNGNARAGFIASLTCIFRECLRILKPGAHGLIWALPRTSHWTATALEDAGFEVRDVITHHFGSGFPKSRDVSKDIDKIAGAQREVIGSTRKGTSMKGGVFSDDAYNWQVECPLTVPATDAAKQWEGWGTALKPASEHWILVRAPLVERTVAANVLAHGTGALNIDACCIGYQNTTDQASAIPQGRATGKAGALAGGMQNENDRTDFTADNTKGRWPANLVLSHGEGCVQVGTRKVRGGNDPRTAVGGVKRTGIFGNRDETQHMQGGYGDADGMEEVERWECMPGCPIALLNAQSGDCATGNLEPWHRLAASENHAMSGPNQERNPRQSFGGDAGGASRFFYCAKPSRDERNGESTNLHPTVKAIALMRWLIRLITPPKGLVLDPFVGSGTTLLAAHEEGFRAIGIERDDGYISIAEARMPRQHDLFAP